MDKFERYIESKYNLDIIRYHALYEQQGGACAICQRKNIRLVIDHDHMCCESGSCGFCIRGLLCYKCNSGLGMFDDNHAIMARAKKYVFEYRRTRGMIKTNEKKKLTRHAEDIELITPQTPRESFGPS